MADKKGRKLIKRFRSLILEAIRKLEVADKLYRDEEERVRGLFSDKSSLNEFAEKYNEALSGYKKLRALYEIVKESDKTKPGVEEPLVDKLDSDEDEDPDSLTPTPERPLRPLPLVVRLETTSYPQSDSENSDSESYWDRRIRQGHWKFRDPLTPSGRGLTPGNRKTPFGSKTTLVPREVTPAAPLGTPGTPGSLVVMPAAVIISVLLFLLFVIGK